MGSKNYEYVWCLLTMFACGHANSCPWKYHLQASRHDNVCENIYKAVLTIDLDPI